MADDSPAPSTGELTTVGTFTATGASLGGPVGAIVGGVIGLGFVIGGRLLKKDPYEDYVQPEPERRKHPYADDGNPCPVAYGNFVRLPGQIMWMSPIKSVEVSQTVAGKGKDTQEIVVDYKYTCNIAVAWCRNFSIAIKRIYANGENIHDTSITQNKEHNVSSCVAFEEPTGKDGAGTIRRLQVITFNITGWDPTDQGWVNGVNIQIDHISGGSNFNQGLMFLRSQETNGTNKTLTFQKCVITETEEGVETGCEPNQIGGVSHGGPAVYRFSGNGSTTGDTTNPQTKYMSAVFHHFGLTFDEDPNDAPILMTDIPGDIHYTGTTYSEIKDFNVTKWGSAIPRLEALVQIHDGDELASKVLERIIKRGNTLAGATIDTAAVVGNVHGYMILGPTTILSSVQEFMAYFNLDAFESFTFSGDDFIVPQLVFQPRDQATKFAIPVGDVGAHPYGQPGVLDREITVSDGTDVPNHMVIDFVDGRLNSSFQPTSSEYINVGSGNTTRRTTKTRTDLLLTHTEAREHSLRFLQQLQQNRDKFKARLPPSYLGLRPGDRLDWPEVGGAGQLSEEVEVRLERVTRGQNGVIEVEGAVDDALVYVQTPEDDVIPPSYPAAPAGPFAHPHIYDLPPLRGSHAPLFGIYVGCFNVPGTRDPADIGYADREDHAPASSTVFRSPDDEISWISMHTQNGTGISGVARTAPLGDGVDYAWDSSNKLEITMHLSTQVLVSGDPELVAAGRQNTAIIGNEIIGFCTVVDLGNNVYELSDLLRGRRDTADHMGEHIANEIFVLLDNDALRFVPMELLDYQRFQIVKAVPSSTSLADIDVFHPHGMKPQGETLKPFTVTARWLRRYTDQSYRIYFMWRTRQPYRLYSGIPMPRTERQHCFKIDVFRKEGPDDFGDRFFVRTLCCCFCEDDEYHIVYTRAEQAEDFHDCGIITDGSFPTYLEFEIYQCSDSVGEGRRRLICARGVGPFIQFDMCPPGG